MLPAVAGRAVTEFSEFCAAQLLVLSPPSALNPPGPGSSSEGKWGLGFHFFITHYQKISKHKCSDYSQSPLVLGDFFLLNHFFSKLIIS